MRVLWRLSGKLFPKHFRGYSRHIDIKRYPISAKKSNKLPNFPAMRGQIARGNRRESRVLHAELNLFSSSMHPRFISLIKPFVRPFNMSRYEHTHTHTHTYSRAHPAIQTSFLASFFDFPLVFSLSLLEIRNYFPISFENTTETIVVCHKVDGEIRGKGKRR